MLKKEETLETLSSTIDALDMRLKSMAYAMQEIKKRALQHREFGDVLRARQEVRRYKQKEATYMKFVALLGNVQSVYDQINDMVAFGDIANIMGQANTQMERLLGSINLDNIDKIMDSLEENMNQSMDVANALGRETSVGIIDDDELDNQLDLLTTMNLPNVPITTNPIDLRNDNNSKVAEFG